MDPIAAGLKYLTADHLSTAAGVLGGAPVMSRAGVILGTLTGALVDPVGHNVCYLVVDSRRWLRTSRYVLPLDTTRFDRSRGALLVDADVADLQEFSSDRFAPLSEKDWLDASFSPRAA